MRGRTWKGTYIARCPACKAHRRLEPGTVAPAWNGRPDVRCSCGHTFTTKALKAWTSADHQCNAKCEASKGHVCECACGGRNHGTAV